MRIGKQYIVPPLTPGSTGFSDHRNRAQNLRDFKSPDNGFLHTKFQNPNCWGIANPRKQDKYLFSIIQAQETLVGNSIRKDHNSSGVTYIKLSLSNASLFIKAGTFTIIEVFRRALLLFGITALIEFRVITYHKESDQLICLFRLKRKHRIEGLTLFFQFFLGLVFNITTVEIGRSLIISIIKRPDQFLSSLYTIDFSNCWGVFCNSNILFIRTSSLHKIHTITSELGLVVEIGYYLSSIYIKGDRRLLKSSRYLELLSSHNDEIRKRIKLLKSSLRTIDKEI